MSNPLKAVALVSGGLDSSTALALSITQGVNFVAGLTFDFGQRAASSEIRHAAKLCEHFGIPHRVMILPWFKQWSIKSALVSDSPLPTPSQEDLDDIAASNASARAVWVPNRNGIFIEIAAGLAETLGATAVCVGFNKEEAATFPDNSIDYLNALSGALSFSTANQVQVISPTAQMDKAQIVEEALRLNLPIDLLWSCYESGSKMCGHCESCKRLDRALNHNQVLTNELFTNT